MCNEHEEERGLTVSTFSSIFSFTSVGATRGQGISRVVVVVVVVLAVTAIVVTFFTFELSNVSI